MTLSAHTLTRALRLAADEAHTLTRFLDDLEADNVRASEAGAR